MNGKITETKELYEEFKYFKNIYTKINLSKYIQLLGDKENDVVYINFVRDTVFSNLIGKLTGNTHFLNWLKEDNKSIIISLETINELSKTLKKNVVSVSYDDDEFIFKFNDKEDQARTVVIKRDTTKETERIIAAFHTLIVKFDNDYKLSDDFLNSDILEVFHENGNIGRNRTKDKVIEIPKARLNSYIKDEDLILKFSDKNEIGARFVSISSKSEKLGLELVEIFQTI